MHIWEEVAQGPHGGTARMQVPGGWLYRVWAYGSAAGQSPAMAVTFVPDAGAWARHTDEED